MVTNKASPKRSPWHPCMKSLGVASWGLYRGILRLAPLLLLVLVLGMTVVGAASDPSPTVVFDQVWQTVREKFYDRTLHGVNWDAIQIRYRSLVESSASEQELAAIVNRMLGELHASHTTYLTADDPAYYDLLDIFSGALRQDLHRLFPDGKVVYTGIGIFTNKLEGKTFISGVLDGLPAHKIGLRVGDEIVAVDGRPFAPIATFLNKRGTPVTLAIRRTIDGPVQEVVVVPDRIRPNRAYLTAMAESARIIQRAGQRVGYIHVWSYAGSQYQALLEQELYSGKLKDADALIWDLRDGWGGAQVQYLDMFTGPGPVLDLRDRAGKHVVEHVKWRRPVAMLINGGTRSGKEILAYGFKKYALGELIGTRTTGAVLAATVYLTASGGLLELAVNDVTVDGERLEGAGVEPTIEVPFNLPYAQGSDPQLERALAILSAPAENPRVPTAFDRPPDGRRRQPSRMDQTCVNSCL